MHRRQFLQTTVAGGVGMGVGIGSVTGQDRTRLDVVDDLGVDDTGSTAIDERLEPHLRNGTRLEFPAGRYRIDHLSLYRLENFGMVATGDATLVPGDYPTDDVWIGGGAVRNVRFEGFRLDTTGTGPTIGFGAFDGLVVRDIDKVGAHTTTRTAFGFEVWERDGSGLVDGLRAQDGDVFRDSVGATAVYTQTEGTITFRNLELAGWSDNGLYASDAVGPVIVDGGYFANNNISQVRLSSPGSTVRDATIVVDRPAFPGSNYRGIRVNDGPGPVTVEDTQIRLERGQGNGGIDIARDGGSVTVRNTRIFVDPAYLLPNPLTTRTGFAIQVDAPETRHPVRPVRVRDTAITGGGTAGAAVLLNRSNSVVERSCINQTGTRDGVIVGRNTEGNRIVDTTITVPGDPIVRRSGSVQIERVSLDGTCRVPDTVSYDQFARGTQPGTESARSPDTSTSTETRPPTRTTSPGFGPLAVVAGLGLGTRYWVKRQNGGERD